MREAKQFLGRDKVVPNPYCPTGFQNSEEDNYLPLAICGSPLIRSKFGFDGHQSCPIRFKICTPEFQSKVRTNLKTCQIALSIWWPSNSNLPHIAMRLADYLLNTSTLPFPFLWREFGQIKFQSPNWVPHYSPPCTDASMWFWPWYWLYTVYYI